MSAVHDFTEPLAASHRADREVVHRRVVRDRVPRSEQEREEADDARQLRLVSFGVHVLREHVFAIDPNLPYFLFLFIFYFIFLEDMQLERQQVD